mgnify:FL=1
MVRTTVIKIRKSIILFFVILFIFSSTFISSVNCLVIDSVEFNFSISNDCECSFDIFEMLESNIKPTKQNENFRDININYWDWRDAEINTDNGPIRGNFLSSIKDQGSCGGCWAFSAVDALEARIRITKQNPEYEIDLSEQYLISCCPEPFCESCIRGASFFAYMYMHNNGGAIPENCFFFSCHDYRENLFVPPCTGKCPHWESLLIPVKIPKYIINADNDFIKHVLIDYGPVVTGLTVYDDFVNYTGGVYDHPDDNPSDPICHEVVLIGFRETPDNPDYNGYWICKNSFGESWGEDGYFKIAYGDSRICNYISYTSCKIKNVVRDFKRDIILFNILSNTSILKIIKTKIF